MIYQCHLIDLIPLLPFSRPLAMLILVHKANEVDQVHMLQETYFESLQIHQVAIMYCFEHTNHDIHVNVLL